MENGWALAKESLSHGGWKQYDYQGTKDLIENILNCKTEYIKTHNCHGKENARKRCLVTHRRTEHHECIEENQSPPKFQEGLKSYATDEKLSENHCHCLQRHFNRESYKGKMSEGKMDKPPLRKSMFFS